MGHFHYHSPHNENTNLSTRNIRFAFFLNFSFTIIEIAGGIYTNSLAILSDALHDLGDTISLGLSWYFDKISKRKPDADYTYGYARFSLLAAFINSVVLITGSLIIIFVVIPRLINPEQPDTQGMIAFSLIGIMFNGIAVLRLRKGKTLNEKVITWHLVEDVLGWVVIFIASLTMYFWYIPVLDPILSLAFTMFILYKVFKNFRSTIRIFLQGRPDEVSLSVLEDRLMGIDGLESVHDLHIWSMDGAYSVMTLHIVVKGVMTTKDINRIKNKIREIGKKEGIQHITIEVEPEACDLDQNGSDFGT